MRPAALALYGSTRYSYEECRFFASGGRFFKGNLHSHSVDSDGNLTSRQLVELYRVGGYHFLALSEHETFYSHQGGSGFHDFLLLPAVEWSSIQMEQGDLMKCHHISGIAGSGEMQRRAPEGPLQDRQTLPQIPFVGAATAAEMARVFARHGCMAVYNHPAWSNVEPAEMGRMDGVFALEVYNHGSELQNHTGYGNWHWDALLRSGVKINAVAGDDNHNDPELFDSFGGWVEVYAPELTHDAISDALLSGAFYASAGPRIFEYGVAGNEVYVKCSPVQSVRFVAGGVIGAGDVILSAPGIPIEQACMRLDGREQYVRIECVDELGRTAWSNPIYAREF